MGGKRSSMPVASHRASRVLTIAAPSSLDALQESNQVARSRRALGDVSNKASKGGAERKPGDDAENTHSLRRSRRLSVASIGNQKPTTKQPTYPNEGRVDDEGNVPAALSRRPSSRTQVTKISICTSKKPVPGAGTRKRQPAEEISCEADVHSKSSRKRGRSLTNITSTGDDANDPATKKQDARRSRGRRSSVSDIVMEDAYELDEVTYLIPGLRTALKSRRECLDLLVTSNDDRCLTRRISGPFDASKYTTGVASWDQDGHSDVEQVSDYVTDIYQRLFDAEEQTRPSPDYMERQDELNGMMRSILVDWLVEVHTKFRLQPETLYLCVNIIDRYLCKRIVERGNLQLVGVTALLIACKYEEIYPPEVKDCVYITDRAYTRQNVLDMEADIVNALKFKMSVPTGYPFMQRFLQLTKAPRSVQDLANFYLEKMLQEYGMLNFRASLVAATAVCLAWSNPDVIELEDPLPGVLLPLLEYTRFNPSEIQDVAVYICAKVRNRAGTTISGSTRPLHAVSRKYESERFSKASVAYEPPSPDFLRCLRTNNFPYDGNETKRGN